MKRRKNISVEAKVDRQVVKICSVQFHMLILDLPLKIRSLIYSNFLSIKITKDKIVFFFVVTG